MRRPTTETCERCAEAVARVRATGCRVSDVRDHGEDYCAAQSVELAGPGTFGAAREYVQVRAPFAGLHARDVEELSLASILPTTAEEVCSRREGGDPDAEVTA